jgi:predicted nucleic acid-binding Zn ribbon protein
MASRTVKAKHDSKPKMDTHQRRLKWLQIAFLVISALLILSMIITAFSKF